MTGRTGLALCGTLLALLGASPLAALAQSELIAPRSLISPLPPAPTNARNVPVEGYVTVRYTVLADGKAVNVRAIDAMPPSIDPAPTIATVGTWTFAPGCLVETVQNGWDIITSGRRVHMTAPVCKPEGVLMEINAAVEEALVAPSYGSVREACCLRWYGKGMLPLSVAFMIMKPIERSS